MFSRFATHSTLLSIAGVLALSGGAVAFNAFGDGASCSKPAQAVAVNDEGATCDKPVEAVAVSDEGATCDKPAEAVAVNDEGATCDKPAAVAVSNDGATCDKPAKAVAVSNEGAACDKPVEAVAVSDEGKTCTAHAQVVAASDEGAACDKPAAAVAVSNEGATCDKPVEAVAASFTPVNAACPVMGGEVNPAGAVSVVNGFTVGYCCDGCKDKFDAKAETERVAFVAANVQETVNASCPKSGRPVAEGKVALHNGFAVGFCCEACQAKWQAEPEAEKTAFVAGFVQPENATCPASGREINPEVVALHRGHAVGFCCNGCKGKFQTEMTDAQRDAVVASFAAETPKSCGCEACTTDA